jgi:arginine N-succinyltransferase
MPFQIRQSFHADVDAILEVAQHLDTVNLPHDREHIDRIVLRSEQSFDGTLAPADREYLFVLEEVDAGHICGTCMIHGQHGTRRAPHVFFRVLEEERYSVTLDRYLVHQCLRIGYNYNGPTEIGGLILLPEYRGHPDSLGKLLSYVRFLYIAIHRAWFRDRVISELLPPLEPDGTSRLWRHIGRPFTGLTYQEADLLSKDNKEFIHALFPHELIYVSMLPEEVKQVIGQVGPETKGVEKMLRRIGFRYASQIDPFDGGPHFVADTDDITLVMNTRRARIGAASPGSAETTWAVLATEQAGRGFRATAARVQASPSGDELGVPAQVLDLLGVEPKGEVWWVAP